MRRPACPRPHLQGLSPVHTEPAAGLSPLIGGVLPAFALSVGTALPASRRRFQRASRFWMLDLVLSCMRPQSCGISH